MWTDALKPPPVCDPHLLLLGDMTPENQYGSVTRFKKIPSVAKISQVSARRTEAATSDAAGYRRRPGDERSRRG
jgi:hypothetical protein